MKLPKKSILYTLACLLLFAACNNNDNTPEAAFSISPESGETGQSISFDAERSIHAHSYSWDWESDGIWDSQNNPNPKKIHVFEEAGHYMVSLEVSNEDGETATLQKSIDIQLSALPQSQKTFYAIALVDGKRWYKAESNAPGGSMTESKSGTVFSMDTEMGIDLDTPISQASVQALVGKTFSFDAGSGPFAYLWLELDQEKFTSGNTSDQNGSEIHISDVQTTTSFMGYPSYLVKGTFNCKLANQNNTKTLILSQGFFALRIVDSN